MFSALAVWTLVAVAVAQPVGVPVNFDPFIGNATLQRDVARQLALTTGTPISTFCVDSANTTLTVRPRVCSR